MYISVILFFLVFYHFLVAPRATDPWLAPSRKKREKQNENQAILTNCLDETVTLAEDRLQDGEIETQT